MQHKSAWDAHERLEHLFRVHVRQQFLFFLQTHQEESKGEKKSGGQQAFWRPFLQTDLSLFSHPPVVFHRV